MSIYAIKLEANSNLSSNATFKIYAVSTVLFFTAAYIASVIF